MAFNSVVGIQIPPTSGTYKVGDIVWSVGSENSPIGWVCTTAGTPGTWSQIADSSSPYSKTIRGFTDGNNQTKALLNFVVPNSSNFIWFDVKLLITRAPSSNPAQSRIIKQSFTLGRNTNASSVIDSALATNNFELLTTTAGGTNTPSASSIAMAVTSGGATDPENVSITAFFGPNSVRGTYVIDVMSTRTLDNYSI